IEQLKTKGYIEWQGKRYTEKEWRAMNHGRIDGRTTKGVHKQPTTGYSMDPNNIGNLPKGEIDTVITSPPYEGAMESSRHANSSLAKVKRNVSAYMDFDSRKSQNIGHKKGKSYLSEMKKVYDQCFSVLKTGGLAVLVTKNFVRNWKMIRLSIGYSGYSIHLLPRLNNFI
ncbi:unnamed protein product, partial [marine sediment metagenome]